MSKQYLFALLCICSPLFLWTQECPELNLGVIEFRLQNQVHTFAATYPNCSELDYDLRISNDVVDLSPLNFLKRINGTVYIRWTENLSSLQGLEGIEEITGKLFINNNPALSDISAFNTLKRVQNLEIHANELLTTLDGFTNLQTVDEELKIFSNDNIRTIPGFPALDSIGTNLVFFNEDALINITGFQNLQEIGSSLSISSCDNLTYVEGFNELKSIQDKLEASFRNLDSLVGFQSLDTIGSDLKLTCNGCRFAVSGFSNLKHVGGSLTGVNSLKSIDGFENLQTITLDLAIEGTEGMYSLPSFPSLKSIGRNLFINRNADLEQLGAFPNISEVGGLIRITSNPVLKSLNGFNSINKIRGIEVVFNDSLKVLNAFMTLDTVVNSMTFSSNNSLVSLAGLEELNFIGRDLEIESCISIKQIDSLTNLVHIGDKLKVRQNLKLSSLEGLRSLNHVGELEINTNRSLQSLNGLESLKEVGKLILNNNDSLKNIKALQSLEKISNEHLKITRNQLLVDLSGLENLRHFENGWLEIGYNDNLKSIDAFPNLQAASLGKLTIRQNPNLIHCNAKVVCNYLAAANEEDVFIEGNADGCNTSLEILRSCPEYLSTVTGKIFVDQNCNFEQDTLDTVVPEVILLDFQTDQPFAITDSVGKYIRGLAFDDTVRFELRALNYFDIQPGTYQIKTADTIALYDQKNFSLCPQETISDLNIDLISVSPPRPGFVHEYEVCIRNTGTIPVAGELSFSFTGENNELWIDSLFVEGERITNSGTTWVSPTIAPFSRSCYEIKAYLIPDESLLGQELLPKAMVNLIDQQDANPEDNLDSLSLTIVGSYDPNDKRASIDSLNFATVDGPVYLEYTIRFQNTGTFRAEFIEVTDTISPAFDLGTFTMLSSSHNYQLKFKEDRLFSWFFPDIQLPPSDEDEAASNGYIKFGIKTKPGVKLDDVLSNKAYIYFDFNSPIITNEATTRFFTVTSISSIPEGFDIKVYPNPAQDYITIEVEDIPSRAEIRVHLFSTDGRLLQDQKVTSLPNGRYTIPTKQLSPGIYFLQLSLAGQRQTIKLMK